MIDDIVVLPRRLSQIKRKEIEVSSATIYACPISTVPRLYGYNEPNDLDYLPFGGRTELTVGQDAVFRFKLVEQTANGILEYFCLSESPVNVKCPKRSSKSKIYCVWVSITDPRTLVMRKYVLWRNVRELLRFETEDSVVDTPVEAAIANELRQHALLYGDSTFIDGLLQNYPVDKDDVLLSELKPFDGVGMFMTLGSNIRAFNDIAINDDPWHRPNHLDVLRDVNLPEVWTDASPIKGSSILPFVLYGSIELSQIAHLLSPRYNVHRYNRPFNPMDLRGDVHFDIPADDSRGIFDIIKYVDLIPYSEFKLIFEGAGQVQCTSARIDCPYSYNRCPADMKSKPEWVWVSEHVAKITSILNTQPGMFYAKLERSWAEELYITIMDASTGSNVHRYFIDMSVASLCTRSLIRDYTGPLFACL